MGNGYLGVDSIKTSSANQELIPTPDVSLGWTIPYQLYKFSFMNYDTDCTVIINNTTTLFLKANQGIEIEKGDKPITSFKVVTSGISYSWIGAF